MSPVEGRQNLIRKIDSGLEPQRGEMQKPRANRGPRAMFFYRVGWSALGYESFQEDEP